MTDYLALSLAKQVRGVCASYHYCQDGCPFYDRTHPGGNMCALSVHPYDWNLETKQFQKMQEKHCIDCKNFKQTKLGKLGAPKGCCTIKNYQDFRAGSHAACRVRFEPREDGGE